MSPKSTERVSGVLAAGITTAWGPEEIIAMPMVIDALTGRPKYLSRDVMKSLLSGNEEIWKDTAIRADHNRHEDGPPQALSIVAYLFGRMMSAEG